MKSIVREGLCRISMAQLLKHMCRLHSIEARQQMNSFQIGRIQGQWKNFLPPIQGGQFRLQSQQGKLEEEMDSELNCSSGSSSVSDSPVFDYARLYKDNLRQRRTGKEDVDDGSSISTVSSVGVTSTDPTWTPTRKVR